MTKRTKLPKKVKIRIINGILIAAGLGLIIAVTGYLRQGLIDAAAAETYGAVQQEAVDIETHEIDYSAVRNAGSSATSWLYVPGTVIDYPLVQGPDNDTYLAMDAYGKPSKAGAIFINFANAGDMSDAKTVIFGHNMADGSMFSALHNYDTEEWGMEHQDAYIYMEDNGVRHYKLLYYLFTEPGDDAVYVVSRDEKASLAAEKLKNEADIIYGEHNGGSLICLSTCTYHKFRTVVVFEYVDDSPPVVSHGADMQTMDVDSGNDAATGNGTVSDTDDGSEDDPEYEEIEDIEETEDTEETGDVIVYD